MRRNQATAAFVAAAGVVVALSGCGHTMGRAVGTAGAPAMKASGAVVQAAMVPCSSLATAPSWLPTAVAGGTVSCASAGSAPLPAHGPVGPVPASQGTAQASRLVSAGPGKTTVITDYTLAGDINANTFEDDPTNGHFATAIELVKYPGSTTLGVAVDGGGFVTSTSVTLASGTTARVTTQVNGLGAVRVEWAIGGNSYLLISSHWATSSGVSGVPTTDLIRMAGSVR